MPEIEEVTVDTPVVVGDPTLSGWSAQGGRYWTPSPTIERLSAGIYEVGNSQRLGAFLQGPRQLLSDDLIMLPDLGTQNVIDEIQKFWAPETKTLFAELGFVHKRGVLMWGPPGTGKTSTTNLVIQAIIDLDGIVFLDAKSASLGMKLVRDREPDRPILVVMEDIDTTIRSGGEDFLLNMLDGQEQINNVVFLATTNYPDKLPDRIIARPSRFDLVIEIGAPTFEARFAYLDAKAPTSIARKELRRWAELANDLPIAYLREMIVLVAAYGRTPEAAIERLTQLRDKKLIPQQSKLQAVG